MKSRFIARFTTRALIASMFLSASVFAQTQGGQPPQDKSNGDHPHGPPPPEAIAACNGKTSGATCSFMGRQGEQLAGNCFRPPARGQQEPQGNASAPSGPVSQIMKPLACRPAQKGN